jgi:hypothetical protein
MAAIGQLKVADALRAEPAMPLPRKQSKIEVPASKTPATRTGDRSDVTVVDANANRIPWTEVSHISDDEMHDLMRDIVNRLYTFHLCADDPGLQAEIDRWMTVAGKWDEPEIDQRMICTGNATGG